MPADVWSAGVTIWELACGRRIFPGASEWDMLCKIAKQKGAPPPIKRRPQFHITSPRFPGEALDDHLDRRVVTLIEGTTAHDPSSRWSAKKAAEPSVWDFRHMSLLEIPLGCSSWAGQRGDFRMQSNVLERDIKAWICADAYWQSEEVADVVFSRSPKKVCMEASEMSHKVEVCFSTRPVGLHKQKLNSLIVRGRCPALRLLAWIIAFKAVLRPWFDELGANITKALGSFSEKDLGVNGMHFLSTPVREWFAEFVTFMFMRVAKRFDKAHSDGGALPFYTWASAYLAFGSWMWTWMFQAPHRQKHLHNRIVPTMW